MLKPNCSSVLKTLFLVLLAMLTVFTQAQRVKSSEWARLLKENGKTQVLSAQSVYNSLDTLNIPGAVAELEKRTADETSRVKIRAKALKSKFLFYWLGPGDSLYAAQMKDALTDAYTIGDPYMIAEFSRTYGEMLNSLGNQALAAQYCMNSLKMQEELGFENFPTAKTFYLTTAEMLYRTANYDMAVHYYGTAYRLKDDSSSPKQYKEFREYYGHSLNATGRSYYYLKKFDSAVYYFQQCMEYAQAHHLSEDLYYIASDNRFDPYLELQQYDSCRKIADELYQAGLPDDSITLLGACFMKGRIAIRTGKLEEGIKWELQAEQYGINTPKQLFQVYKDLAFAFEKLHQQDKALVYLKKFQELENANNEMKRKASASFLEAESEFQKSKVMLVKLSEEKTSQVSARNILIAILVFLGGISIYYFYRKRKKSELARKEAEDKFHFFQTQYRSAEEQLEAFKAEVSEKNRHIEELLAEKNKAATSNGSVDTIDNLSRQIILTEKDWQVFKETFDTVYPRFFTALKLRIPDITNAELRMASLIRLNFNTKHMAGMLGISETSVRKTKYRLKKRFKEDAESPLEEIISTI